MQYHWIKTVAAGTAALLLAGCNRDGVKVYHVTDDQTQSPPAQAPATSPTAPALSANAAEQPLPAGHPDISGASGVATDNANSPLTWKTPDGWTQVPAGELRVASFKVNKDGKMVDISVIPLGPMAGTDSANVNRWRGQVGLPQVTDDEIQKSAEKVDVAGQAAELYDVVGTNPSSGEKSRIIGVIQHRPDATWFYKMTGDADLAEAQKPAFVEFLKSLKLTVSTPQTEMPATLPPNHPAIGGMDAAPATGPVSHEGQPNWQVPAGWQEVSGGQFLIAKFTISDGGAQASVNVSSSAGDGGGLAANITRWRGQLGLPPADDFSATQIDVNGGKGQRVDLDGTNVQTGKPAKLVAIIVSQGGQTWFYKLMGDSKAVDAQKNAFIQFVQGAKY